MVVVLPKSMFMSFRVDGQLPLETLARNVSVNSGVKLAYVFDRGSVGVFGVG